jgi:hypothetical protein
MKKLLLASVFCAIGFSAMAQTQTNPVLDNNRKMIETPYNPILWHPTKALGKMDTYSGWYNWTDALYTNFSISMTHYSNSYIWPDSTVKQLYGAAGGGVELGYVGTASVGEVLDPKSSYFGDGSTGYGAELSKYNSYTWDSLAIFFNHSHPVAGTVDTLIVQFYVSKFSQSTSSPIVATTLNTDQDPSCYIKYNYLKNLGVNYFQQDTLLLTEADTNTNQANPSVAMFYVGKTIPANEVVGFTMSYFPGCNYTLGDTMGWDWTPAPTHMLNSFMPYTLSDASRFVDASYNNDEKVITAVRYNDLTRTNGWQGRYIPGDAWLDPSTGGPGAAQYILSSFHLTCETVGIKGVGNIDDNAKLYPNPTNGPANLDFNLTKSGNVTIQIKDITGKVVSTTEEGALGTGMQHIKLNTENLKTGVYFCTLNTSNGSQTFKFMVTK